MKPHFAPCEGCGRHIRVSEGACPFCDVATSAEFRATAPPTPLPRGLSRAAIFAIGAAATVAGVACSSSSDTTSTPVYGAPVMDTGTAETTDTAAPSDGGVDGDTLDTGGSMPLYGGPFDTGSTPDTSHGG